MLFENNYQFAREKYMPVKVRVLFVAESPPNSGSFFYFRRTNGRDNLFRETMRALGFWKIGVPMRKNMDKTGLLGKFRSRGFYLIDVCGTPVDKLPAKLRSKRVEQGLEPLLEQVKRLGPSRILVVKVSIYYKVKAALAAAGFASRIVNRGPILFPSHGNQGKYRRQLRNYLR
ncbi:MAG TPA: hypothetical protein VFE98_06195 [Candidatus Bathyarchaeia archaeon]|nr:hypothetical protein [Candidatus Bathyarchaeia archaeon]